MRSLIFAALVLPLVANTALANTTSSSQNPFTQPKTIKIKEEIVNHCGNFPYAPTLAIEPKTATLEDMQRARGAVDDYISEVSAYEKCLLSLDKVIGSNLSAKDSDYIVMVFNRAQEERDVLSLDFNKLVDEYNAAHGIKTTEPPKPAKGKKPATGATTTTPAAKPKPAATKTP
jgi:hypothetical protein